MSSSTKRRRVFFPKTLDGIRSSRPRCLGLLLFLLAPVALIWLFSPNPETLSADTGGYLVEVQTGVQAKMRDGVHLAADIYRPKVSGKFPVLLQRTPYDRKNGNSMGVALASHGYLVVIQDTRGRYDSEGKFYPFRFEGQDGYDTVEWVSALENSNGQVGMFGGSYVGATQMLASMAKPPHLQAIFPYVTASEYYDGWTYQSGALMRWFASTWASGLSIDTLSRETAMRSKPKQWLDQMPAAKFPLLDPAPVAELASYYQDWVDHESDDDYWRKWKISDHYGEMTVKGLHAGGWHDIFLKGSIRNYTGLRDGAANPKARSGQRLMVGPWAHAPTSPEGKIGDVVFGKNAVLDSTAVTLKWYDYVLKGVQNEFATSPPVRVFIMGENVWRDEKEFPLARTRYTKYFLHAVKGARTISGDGVLKIESPGNQPPEIYDYDPAHPVPTIGGRLCCDNAFAPGPFNQRPNESRQDVLVFSTPPLEKEVEVTGFVTLELFAVSSAVDTDFTALLADVDSTGYARFLTDGIVRARFRNSLEKPESIVPGKVYKYSIDLWATSNLFKPGHRIRLYVSSSNFPRFERNLNTGEPARGSERMVIAKQTLYHDAERRSALILPIVPR